MAKTAGGIGDLGAIGSEFQKKEGGNASPDLIASSDEGGVLFMSCRQAFLAIKKGNGRFLIDEILKPARPFTHLGKSVSNEIPDSFLGKIYIS